MSSYFCFGYADEIVKKFLKLKNVQRGGFVGVIDIWKDFEKFTEEKFLSRYQNMMVISHARSNFIEKLIEVSQRKLYVKHCYNIWTT